jgi:hypothetical protein
MLSKLRKVMTKQCLEANHESTTRHSCSRLAGRQIRRSADCRPARLDDR